MCLEDLCQGGNGDHSVCSHSWAVYVSDGPQLIYFVGATTAPPAGRLCTETSYQHAAVLTLTVHGQMDVHTADAVNNALTCQQNKILFFKVLVSHGNG